MEEIEKKVTNVLKREMVNGRKKLQTNKTKTKTNKNKQTNKNKTRKDVRLTESG